MPTLDEDVLIDDMTSISTHTKCEKKLDSYSQIQETIITHEHVQYHWPEISLNYAGKNYSKAAATGFSNSKSNCLIILK